MQNSTQLLTGQKQQQEMEKKKESSGAKEHVASCWVFVIWTRFKASCGCLLARRNDNLIRKSFAENLYYCVVNSAKATKHPSQRLLSVFWTFFSIHLEVQCTTPNQKWHGSLLIYTRSFQSDAKEMKRLPNTFLQCAPTDIQKLQREIQSLDEVGSLWDTMKCWQAWTNSSRSDNSWACEGSLCCVSSFTRPHVKSFHGTAATLEIQTQHDATKLAHANTPCSSHLWIWTIGRAMQSLQPRLLLNPVNKRNKGTER